MKNKVLKNVVLFACVLGLVLFPVTSVYAVDGSGTSSDPYIIYNDLTFDQYQGTIATVSNDYSNNSYISNIINHFNIDTDLIYFAISNSAYSIVYTYVYEGTYPDLSISNSSDPNVFTSVVPNSPASKNFYQYTVSSNTYSQNLNNYANSSLNVNTIRDNFFYVPNNLKFVLSYNNESNYYMFSTQNIPDGFPYSIFTNPIVPSDPDVVYSSQAPFFYNIVQAGINDPNYDTTDSWAHFRVTVGLFPYMWEYYQRWYYNTHFGYMEDIKSSLLEMASMADNMQDIADRLALAFPDDQVELNDSIAETLLDDTNGTGLTAEKVSNAKSDFDEGVSMYQIDTSQSQYSTPFSAIQSGDWSFWSSTTLNNLGSGYQYTYTPQTRSSKKASNDNDDIYESNQKSLFDLLGW